jgi:hypothetical protein
MQQRRVLVGTLAAQDADLRPSEGIELRREGIPDLCDADLLVGQAARSIELRQVSRYQASALVDVVLDEVRTSCLVRSLRISDI